MIRVAKFPFCFLFAREDEDSVSSAAGLIGETSEGCESNCLRAADSVVTKNKLKMARNAPKIPEMPIHAKNFRAKNLFCHFGQVFFSGHTWENNMAPQPIT